MDKALFSLAIQGLRRSKGKALRVLAAQERDGAWLSRQRWLIQLGPALGPGGYPHRPGGAGHVG